MEIFIINLKRSADRRVRIEQAFKKLELRFQLFEAIDGYALTANELAVIIDPNNEYPRKFKPGEVGCFLSHYNVIKRIVEEKLPYALILEDDIEVSNNLPQLLLKLEKVIKQGDVISLYSSFPAGCKLRTENKIDEAYDFLKPEEGELVVGNVAYIITQEVAQKMVQALLPMNNVIDDWRFWIEKGFVRDFKVVFPHPIDLSDNYSDIHESFGGTLLNLKKFLVNNNVPFLSTYILQKRKRHRWAARKQSILVNGKTPKKIFC
jgi:glycosyl transferase, family 25